MEGVLRDAIEGPYQRFFETYGRRVDLEFITSSGDDESAQRADAVAVEAKKPFAVIDATWATHDVFEGTIAASKIPVYGNSSAATYESTQKQAPYRWGQADAMATALNTAEFVGKQVVGRKRNTRATPRCTIRHASRVSSTQKTCSTRSSSTRRSPSTGSRSIPPRPSPTRRPPVSSATRPPRKTARQ
jgi:hypothetical protein